MFKQISDLLNEIKNAFVSIAYGDRVTVITSDIEWLDKLFARIGF